MNKTITVYLNVSKSVSKAKNWGSNLLYHWSLKGVLLLPILHKSAWNSVSLLQGVTGMVTLHALGHILWMTDTIIVLLTAVEGFEWNKPHQDVLLDIYLQHGEINHTAAIIHSSLDQLKAMW